MPSVLDGVRTHSGHAAIGLAHLDGVDLQPLVCGVIAKRELTELLDTGGTPDAKAHAQFGEAGAIVLETQPGVVFPR
ncbi:MAG TPA: hypothetical protein VKE24_05730 [Candidatus Acidoferrales bacterium]|nr:hypothetical protein [Candidatus Acidoferrales bacterium]